MTLLYTALFVGQLTLLFFLSRETIKQIFRILRRIFPSDTIVFTLISLIFLPGTILHELSHFFMAMILFLRVRDLKILPEWDDKGYIKLGHVLYEKKDVFRSIIVGIAPVIVGLLFFLWLSTVDTLSFQSYLLNLFTVYIIFVVSTSMFSSKQDLIDIVYIIPLFLMIAAIIYIFQIDITAFFTDSVIAVWEQFLYAINIYLAISLGIHLIMVGSLKILLKHF